MKEKTYFTGYHLYKADVEGNKATPTVYVVGNNLAEVTAIASGYCGDLYQLNGMKKVDGSPVIAPLERTKEYKLFSVHVVGEWSGIDAYIVAETLTAAARLAEEYAGYGYRVERLGEIYSWFVGVAIDKPEEV
jgi:hypothetical protein